MPLSTQLTFNNTDMTVSKSVRKSMPRSELPDVGSLKISVSWTITFLTLLGMSTERLDFSYFLTFPTSVKSILRSQTVHIMWWCTALEYQLLDITSSTSVCSTPMFWSWAPVVHNHQSSTSTGHWWQPVTMGQSNTDHRRHGTSANRSTG